jgi:GT2 family glycosyltransferase
VIDASIIIVSYQTRDLLRRCLQTIEARRGALRTETIVVDNASRDGSVRMLEVEFPWVRAIALERNIGFGAANNRGFAEARGRYFVLLNSDAFVGPRALELAVRHMDEAPEVAVGGARLIGENGCWQPSARMFPSPLNDLLLMSGLAARFPRSKFFGRMDRRWADPAIAVETDWVCGAFLILRPAVARTLGGFDESFFMYFEEVDLCRRVKASGHRVWYWPDIEVVHLGGESARTVESRAMSPAGAQVALWRLRSEWIYYRKHQPGLAWLARTVEWGWPRARALRNSWSADSDRRRKARDCRQAASLAQQAWVETSGGRVAPREW